MKPLLLFFIFVIFSFAAHAGHSNESPTDTLKTDTTVVKKRIRFKFELSASSNNTYQGRQDTSHIPIITPLFRYTTKRRFYFETCLVKQGEGKKPFDEWDITLGKRFVFSDKWSLRMAYTHYFFDSQVSRITASVKNYFSTSLNYDWKILYSQLRFSWSGGNDQFTYKSKKVNTKTNDFNFTFANSRQFDINDVLKKGFYLTLTPEVDILYGTQNYLTTYKGKGDKTNKTYSNQVSKFALTAYSFSFDVAYTMNKFTIDLTPYYTIPMNTPSGESSSPYFVMTASVYYIFSGKK